MAFAQVLEEGIEKYRLIVAAVSLVLALMQVFFGYRLLCGWISLTGFLIGFAIGWPAFSAVFEKPAWVPVVLGAVCGLLVGWLAYRVYLAGVFLYCGLLALTAIVAVPFPDGSSWAAAQIVIAIAAFLVAGILSVRYSRPVIIVISALSGAYTAAADLALLKASLSSTRARGAVTLMLAAAGLFIQFLTTRHMGGGRARRRRRR